AVTKPGRTNEPGKRDDHAKPDRGAKPAGAVKPDQPSKPDAPSASKAPAKASKTGKPPSPSKDAGSRTTEAAPDLVAAGAALFNGAGGCAACHGGKSRGRKKGLDLADGEWIHVDGTA